jgi:glutaminyl-tRNA synthetase
VRLYDNLFTKEDPDDAPEGQDWRDNLNPHSLEVLADCKLEPALKGLPHGERVQFERLGYFSVDPESNLEDRLVFNRTVTLKDTWAKIQKRGGN